MSEHAARVEWRRASPDFGFDTFNRDHTLRFKDGEIAVAGDALPAHLGHGAGVDPEALFAAALSACHMLSFLAVAARMRLIVDAYDDDATAVLEDAGAGKAWVSRVVLRPRVAFAAPVASETLERLHDLAHRHCFLTRSVTSEVSVEPRV